MNILKMVGTGLIALLAGIQLIPVDRDNPPVTAGFDGPPEVEAVLKTACYNCHSNETDWPWYAYVAPMKFAVADHVEEGRGEFNLSEWGSFTQEFKDHLRHEMWEEVEEGKMPLPNYVWLHPEAVLSREQKETLRQWSLQAAQKPAGEGEGDAGHEEHDH